MSPSRRPSRVVLIPHLEPELPLVLAQHRTSRLIVYRATPDRSSEERLHALGRALADPKRVEILALVGRGVGRAPDLVTETGLSRSTVHHHLALLRDAGLVALEGNARAYTYVPRRAAAAEAAEARRGPRRNGGGSVMRYTLLGRSGLRVSEVALGTMTFGEAWGWGASPEESRRDLRGVRRSRRKLRRHRLQLHGRESEEILGELVEPDRERFVVATKYTLTARAATIPTPEGTTARTSCRRSRRASAACARSTSTSCGSTCGTG